MLALTPFLYQSLGLVAFLVVLQLPVYMLHQYEEHAHGAFHAYFNRVLGHGRDVLTMPAIAWTNILGVWAVDLAALYLAVYVSAGLGLIAVYLTLVNALVHLLMALVTRRYNPGLWTALFLFVPAGGVALNVIAQRAQPSLGIQALSLGIAVLLHTALIVHMRRRAVLPRRVQAPVERPAALP